MDKKLYEEKQFKEAIERLTDTTEHWNSIKLILQEEIQAHQNLISFIDTYMKEKEDRVSKLN